MAMILKISTLKSVGDLLLVQMCMTDMNMGVKKHNQSLLYGNRVEFQNSLGFQDFLLLQDSLCKL